MKTLPINKIFLTGFAFVLTHWRQIGKISILPLIISLPFLLIFSDLLALMMPILRGETLPEMALPDNALIYLLLFSYGYFMLCINMYRLVLLGSSSVNIWRPNGGLRQIARFMGLHLLIGSATILPVILTGLGFLQLVMSFLIVPIMLNFVNIAINQPSKYRWNLTFVTQSNLFFLQIILPVVVELLFSALGNILGLGVVLGVVVRIITFYWTLVTLALCYQIIETPESQNPTLNKTNNAH